MPVTIRESLAGRRALVTGGSKGIGAAVAGRLAERIADGHRHCRSFLPGMSLTAGPMQAPARCG